MIITRYLIKEVFMTLMALTFVLLLIFLSQQLMRYLSYAASGKIAANALLQIIGFEVPILLAVLLPLGLYLGVILTYGRLYAENELRVLHACGLSMWQLTTVTSLVSILVTAIVFVLMLWINPTIVAAKDKALQGGSAGNFLETLIPGRFQIGNDGKRVIYVEKMSRDHQRANNLFIAEQQAAADETGSKSWVVLSASDGYQMVDSDTHLPFVVAQDGYRYEGVPGQNDYQIVQFKKYAVRLSDVDMTVRKAATEAIPTTTLWQNYRNPDNASELQWRLAIPLSAFLLALMAIPLSQVKPRQGRYAMIFPAILIYIVYMNLLFAGRNLIEQKLVSTTLGLWWAHALVLLVIILLMSSWRTRHT